MTQSSLGRADLSFADSRDIDEFTAMLGKFESGEITADQWRGFRLLRGTYGQRQDDQHMLRVKIPQGALDAAQLTALADVAERYSRGYGHITTRQNLQFHFVALTDAEPAMRHLAEAGLTTREACGNSVRNITCCPQAGVSPTEAFDVTPYSQAMTRYFLRHPLSAALPRKFKIAFEGCGVDHAAVSIHDIGVWAHVENGERRFRLNVGGGTAILCRSGNVLAASLPAGELLFAAEAILRVFHRLGDYQRRQRNRMKFLIKQIGWENFVKEFETELAKFKSEGGAPLLPESPAAESAPTAARADFPTQLRLRALLAKDLVRGPGILASPRAQPVLEPAFARWLQTNVQAQRQNGFVSVTVTVPLGDLTGGQIRGLALLVDAASDGTLRTTAEQDVVLRWVPESQLREVYVRLASLGLALGEASTIANVTSCPGAESCKLAVTQSRGLGRLLEDHIRANPWLIEAAPDLNIKMSGCPNGCGRHHIAGIGFQGSLRKIDGRAVPQYFVFIGGRTDAEAARFGRLTAKIIARRIPEALDRLIKLYLEEHLDDESASAFFTRVELSHAQAVLAPLEVLSASDARAEDFIDLGETLAFAPETMAGECAS